MFNLDDTIQASSQIHNAIEDDGTIIVGEKPLRFITCGSVDDGKSTLLGRLLWDTKSLMDDQVDAVETTNTELKHLNLANLVDGLQAEREQGITIDVAYRYFATSKRSFIVADTPGHVQYTRNMATGASTADLAVLLVDARTGIIEQTRRHAAIVALMGIKQIVLAVNKIDLINYDQIAFEAIKVNFESLAKSLNFQSINIVPVSALLGANVVSNNHDELNWYKGPALLELLEKADVGTPEASHFRFPVQRVSRPSENFRGYQGTIAGGHIKAGDTIRVLPSNNTAKIDRIVTFDGDLQYADTGSAVTLVLDRHIDISRSDILAKPEEGPFVTRRFGANLVVLHDQGLTQDKRYLLISEGQDLTCTIKLQQTLDLNSLDWKKDGSLLVNTIAKVEIILERNGVFDIFALNRITGSFIIIDPDTKDTVAGGMITANHSNKNDRSEDDIFVTLEMPKKLALEFLQIPEISSQLDKIKLSETRPLCPDHLP